MPGPLITFGLTPPLFHFSLAATTTWHAAAWRAAANANVVWRAAAAAHVWRTAATHVWRSATAAAL
jgi:hypothetical protein